MCGIPYAAAEQPGLRLLTACLLKCRKKDMDARDQAQACGLKGKPYRRFTCGFAGSFGAASERRLL
jgi:hypothetical protein